MKTVLVKLFNQSTPLSFPNSYPCLEPSNSQVFLIIRDQNNKQVTAVFSNFEYAINQDDNQDISKPCEPDGKLSKLDRALTDKAKAELALAELQITHNAVANNLLATQKQIETINNNVDVLLQQLAPLLFTTKPLSDYETGRINGLIEARNYLFPNSLINPMTFNDRPIQPASGEQPFQTYVPAPTPIQPPEPTPAPPMPTIYEGEVEADLAIGIGHPYDYAMPTVDVEVPADYAGDAQLKDPSTPRKKKDD